MESGRGVDEDQFLELTDVNVARGDRVVLHGINLTIRALGSDAVTQALRRGRSRSYGF
jgi:ABC-type molybdenum transport system ATPase subunit/photorepair protein PhrA